MDIKIDLGEDYFSLEKRTRLFHLLFNPVAIRQSLYHQDYSRVLRSDANPRWGGQHSYHVAYTTIKQQITTLNRCRHPAVAWSAPFSPVWPGKWNNQPSLRHGSADA
jgi:hypothetical protein